MDELRRRARRGEVGLEENGLPATAGRDAETQAIAHDEVHRAWEPLRTLPDEAREILVLRDLLGWRVKDIGEHLHLTENSVSVTIRRSLETMRRRWDEA